MSRHSRIAQTMNSPVRQARQLKNRQSRQRKWGLTAEYVQRAADGGEPIGYETARMLASLSVAEQYGPPQRARSWYERRR